MAKSKNGMKLIIILIAVAVCTFLLSPIPLGPVRELRILHYLKEVGILTDHRSDELLVELLQSPDLRVQVDAILAMSRKETPDPLLVKTLRRYIDGTNAYSLKNLAIYALGELRIREALPQLESRLGDLRYDQEELQAAIGKINGTVPKSWWKNI